LQQHSYNGPRLDILNDFSLPRYIPTGWRKTPASKKLPPSKLAIYRDQFYEPVYGGVDGRSDHGDPADELDPYRRELTALDVPVDDDQDDDTSTLWHE
jgi:hypothetical protein